MQIGGFWGPATIFIYKKGMWLSMTEDPPNLFLQNVIKWSVLNLKVDSDIQKVQGCLDEKYIFNLRSHDS